MSKKTYDLIESILGECDIKTKKGWMPLSNYKKEYDITVDSQKPKSKFEKDLAYGQEHENLFKQILLLSGDKIEVKTERSGGPKNWDNTGNIFIEYESHDKAGGLAGTEADWWMHFLTRGNDVIGGFVLNTDYLKEKAREYYLLKRIAWGGDDGKSRGVIIPTSNVF